ncbi:MAG: hypothetical protein MHM6MM_009338, partial [Cercozoa sp. M6MM]
MAEEAAAIFVRLGLKEQEAAQTAGNAKKRDKLLAILAEAGVADGNGVTSEAGKLLYSFAMKVSPAPFATEHRGVAAKLIVEGGIDSQPKV